MDRFLGGPLRLNERAANNILSGWISPSRYEQPINFEKKSLKFVKVRRTT